MLHAQFFAFPGSRQLFFGEVFLAGFDTDCFVLVEPFLVGLAHVAVAEHEVDPLQPVGPGRVGVGALLGLWTRLAQIGRERTNVPVIHVAEGRFQVLRTGRHDPAHHFHQVGFDTDHFGDTARHFTLPLRRGEHEVATFGVTRPRADHGRGVVAHVHGVQDPVTAFFHFRHADDYRLGGDIQPPLQVQCVVVDGGVVDVGIIGEVADVLEAVERGMGFDRRFVEELVGLIHGIAIDVRILGQLVGDLREGRHGKRQQGGSKQRGFHHYSFGPASQPCRLCNKMAGGTQGLTRSKSGNLKVLSLSASVGP
ncbi:hypothetical protein D3C76_1076180 [compost metagenome]